MFQLHHTQEKTVICCGINDTAKVQKMLSKDENGMIYDFLFSPTSARILWKKIKEIHLLRKMIQSS